MGLVYADLHIHIGRTSQGAPVKITASPNLTLKNIVRTAEQKGLQLVGIVDAACSGVLADLEELTAEGTLIPLEGGGYRWGKVTILLGSEVEIAHGSRGAHFLAFFPQLAAVQEYFQRIAPRLSNPSLSTQRLNLDADSWLETVLASGGAAVAAHAFTPHKGVYGSCVRRLRDMFAHPEKLAAIELGLSADTAMAQCISDTHSYAYLANSDAHSPGSIGREFTAYELPRPSFQAWRAALENGGAGIRALHGMDPRLGKYHRSFCPRCAVLAAEAAPVLDCPRCGGEMVLGVWDRVQQIADFEVPPQGRPPYKVHVPLAMLPGIGPAACRKLLSQGATELDILYRVPLEEIARAAGQRAASVLARLRAGQLTIKPGGGGKYGKVT